MLAIQSDKIIEELHAIVAAATRAPSGDNTQPWRFDVNAAELCIDVRLDPSRDLSPMNSGQRMSLIACGAAIENALSVAREQCWQSRLEFPEVAWTEELESCPLVARIRLEHQFGHASDRAARIVAARVTNRRMYDARPVPAELLADLESAVPARDGIRAHWIGERGRLEALADVIARSDGILFSEPSMRAAFLANVRFDLPADAEAESGLPLAALEADAGVRASMRVMKRLPQAAFKLLGMRAIFTSHARKLIRSASGLCVLTVESESPTAELHVGRAMQQAWLALTERGLAAQPMMSAMVLDCALHHGSPELIEALKRQNTAATLADFRAELERAGISGRPAFLLRFGYAAAPSGRTGRRQP